MSSNELSDVVSQLGSSLNDVEKVMAELLERPLAETLASLPGPIERAKLMFWITYTIHSCSWMHAKLQATDPQETGVMDELNRIKSYNGKINAAQKAGTASADETEATTSQRNMKLDKDAASRFIKAAISNQPKTKSSNKALYTVNVTVSDPLDGPGKHSRFSTYGRQDDSRKQAENSGDRSSSEDEDISIINGDEDTQQAGSAGVEANMPKREKRSKTSQSEDVKGKKRKRADAEGLPSSLESDIAHAVSAVPSDETAAAEAERQRKKDKKERKERKKNKLAAAENAGTSSAQASSTEADELARKERKKEKKRLRALQQQQ